MYSSSIFFKSIFWRGLYFFSLLILNISISRCFTANTVGEFYYIISLLSFFQLILGFSIESAMGFYLSKKQINESQLAIVAILWTFCAITLYVASSYFWKDYFVENINHTSAVLFLAGNMIISFFMALFYAKFDFILPNLILITANILLFLLIPNKWLFNIFISKEQYIQLYFVLFMVQGLALMILFLKKYFTLADVKSIKFIVLKQFLRFAAIASITNLFTFLVSRIDYWFVNRYCTNYELGNYIQASKLAQLFYILPSILAGIIFPITASNKKDTSFEVVQILSRCLLLLYLFICTFVGIFGYWLFPFVFGSSFNQMFYAFALTIPGIISYSIVHLFAAYFSGMKLLQVNLIGTFISLILVVFGDWFLIPKYGIFGAAFVTSISYLSYLVYFLIHHKKLYKSSFLDFLIFKKSDAKLVLRLLEQKLLTTKSDEA